MHFVFLLLLVLAATAAEEKGPTCASHPAFDPTWIPPLLRSWELYRRPALFEKMLYAPRHYLDYYPVDDPDSTKYDNLDFLYIGGGFGNGDLARLYFNRPAKLYLFIGVKREGGPARLSGWKSEGYALLQDKDNYEIPYGVFQKGSILVPKIAYVFSKTVDSVIDIPAEQAIWREVKLPTNVRTHLRIAEINGDPSPPVGKFQGKEVEPNKECPAELHKVWVARHSDTSDPTLKDRVFGTWHPVWDPCFRCTYGHDHGSDPKALLDYDATFEYTAVKNGFENESHEGFKGFVFRMGKYSVYYNIHAQTSRIRRIKERYHTTVMVIKDDKGELMAELTHKADFGFLAARGGIGVGFVPLRSEDNKVMAEQNLNYGEKRLRSVNVINEYNLDRRFRYQLQKGNLMRGVYEGWVTGQICGLPKRAGEIIVDIKNAITGIKSAGSMEMIKLHRETQNVGLMRSLKMDLTMGLEHCKFKNGQVNGGYFYTDPRGEYLVNGPGFGAVRQFIHPDFKLRMHGFFELEEFGQGVFADGATGFWFDHGFGINTRLN